MAIRIDDIVLYTYKIPLSTPFRISAGVINEKEGVLVELRSGDFYGWGEASVDAVPFYAHETVGSVIDLISRALRPLILGKSFETPDELVEIMDSFRGGNFAKAGIEAAFWDVYGKISGKPVHELLGGTRKLVESGPSIGIKKTPSETVHVVAEKLSEGWRRIKLKVSPGFDFEYIKAVRHEFPDISLMVDANNAYGLNDFDLIAAWDQFNLLMIEQPLCEDDIYFHSLLRKKIKTPVCLDESIHSFNDALTMIKLEAADILNIKVCRVGGLVNARKIHDLCKENGVANWIGSRIGSGVAEAARLAAATLENCSLPSDCVISGMYMSDDILTAPYEIVDGCMIKASSLPGLGIDVDRLKLKKYCI